jgi:hypothetical protein
MFVIELTWVVRLLLYRSAGLPRTGRFSPLKTSLPKFFLPPFFAFIDKNPDNLFPYISSPPKHEKTH